MEVEGTQERLPDPWVKHGHRAKEGEGGQYVAIVLMLHVYMCCVCYSLSYTTLFFSSYPDGAEMRLLQMISSCVCTKAVVYQHWSKWCCWCSSVSCRNPVTGCVFVVVHRCFIVVSCCGLSPLTLLSAVICSELLNLNLSPFPLKHRVSQGSPPRGETNRK